ncbi:UDP-N-acetylmuramoylalanyl-D-glutamyl-2, 6-diaminopimelate--D-alanyl-D-alanine ligase [Skermanella stibiiresistens SB22]|uniref:UDP-N-acetylmuramoyl-tripeptide--D-alanyl-D-alanine ligase n=1 Tax=Skermanella stibiiresistens SB22 TaxID=1385369 RepID=W9GYJ7_9PROT|nr:UDP-N-acetylmuramoylalanyl-D-glutamyl-2,6-diaminopimelate--D-alanyl-D-alanine ligase [Skermanella stibiiresistens]EWY37522.1 UDP-N-acetylmuramoylalanyl-D-glutamyl-2, 6-diaminopimelate--D-alanyl-D-alanine ligase [Skermanella stibiiresistens SB22]
MTRTELPVLWTAGDTAAATNGTSQGPDWNATGVSIDSRTVNPGDLFIALSGPNFDGHAYVASALAAGAAAAVVSRRPDGVAADAPLVLVEDTFAALQDLGSVARLRSNARIVAVTGSVGKTSTKEALGTCLAALAPTFATVGSLNNHWGVPLSLARMPPDCTYAVFELGMNHAGEIGPLSRQVRPDVAVITNIEAVHLAHFASVEAIADAKAEIFEGMAPNGAVVLNRDNPHYARLVAAARTRGLSRVLGFGKADDAAARLTDCSIHATCSAVTAVILGETLRYCLSLPGRHHVTNSLAVLLAVHALGGDVAAAARALATLKPIKGRGVRRRVQLAQGAATVIDESYNASPVSMEAAFQVLAKSDPGVGGRRIAVLGDMLELGERAPQLHLALAEPLKAAGADLVFCCGPNMRRLFDKLPAAARGAWEETSAALAPRLAAAVRAGDILMVKGSLGSRMALLVEAVAALDTSSTSTKPSTETPKDEAARAARQG